MKLEKYYHLIKRHFSSVMVVSLLTQYICVVLLSFSYSLLLLYMSVYSEFSTDTMNQNVKALT